MSDLKQSKPEVYNDLDSLIKSGLSVISLWAGVAILLGSYLMGSLLTLIHAITMILFVSNTWTPKVDTYSEITNMLIAIAEIFGGIIIAFSKRPQLPAVSFKDD